MNRICRKLMAGVLAVCLILTPATPLLADNDNTSSEVITIGSSNDFARLAESCRDDAYSIGKTVELKCDLDLSELEDFEGIPYFDGVFHGNGYTISNADIARDGSEYGLFRYLGKSAKVEDLHVSGIISMSGTQEHIGGIAGVNYGIISNCSFSGKVSGNDSVGGIVGINKQSGIILGCSNEAVVSATDHTGGIAGFNEGIISECSNSGSVNVEELDMTLDLGGVDIGTLNLLQNVVTKNNMGGIAGGSSGTVQYCENEGAIGYPHVGYNVGGIAGVQNGRIIECTNRGEINGRKDIGGIVGQAEPYIESEYLQDSIDATRENVNQLSRTFGDIFSTIGDTSAQVKSYADSLNEVSDRIDEVSDAADTTDPQTKEYVDNLNQALDNIESVDVDENGLDEEQKETISDNLTIIKDNLDNLQNQETAEEDTSAESSSSDETDEEDSAEKIVDRLSDEWSDNDNRTKTLQEIADTIDAGIQSINDSINLASDQLQGIRNEIGEDFGVITGENDYIEDVSSVNASETTTGVISGCCNRGEVNGDLNVGGIAGNMNIEYEIDPELDLDFSGSMNITLRSTVNVVILHSINYGHITAKKNSAGGIIGLQEIGFVYDCEGYGSVEAESGSYVGGVVGNSNAAIKKCYSLSSLCGTEYVGGIAGAGNAVSDSVSLSLIDADGERIGAILGYLQDDGTIENNCFVNEDFGGVDNINYAGKAESVSYEDVMEMEDIPDGFSKVTVTFQSEDEVVDRLEIPYGSSLFQDDFPEILQKDGYYVEWEKEDSYDSVTANLILNAIYVPWMESVGSKERSNDGKTLVLAQGEFYEDATLKLTSCDGPQDIPERNTVLYAYDWEIDNRGEDTDTAKIHLFVGQDRISQAVLMAKIDGTWENIDAQEDGSYLVAEIPRGAAVAVVIRPDFPYWIFLPCAAVALLLLLIVVKKRRKRVFSHK